MEKKWLVVVVILLLVGVALGYYYVSMGNKPGIKVLAAGSLAVPFKKLANEFEEKYGVKVYIETAGSIQTVKKVSELGIKADVVAVADYKAIVNYLMPKYTDWYAKFAENSLVIVYTNHSKYASQINRSNWMDIMKKDVRIGFSSPNDDPCGYRAVMMFYLAELKYGNGIFESVVENNTGIEEKNGTIIVPPDSSLLNNTGRVFIKEKSVSLLADLETGNIDYAIEYRSVAKQHGLPFIELPDDINLSNSSFDSFYGNAVVKLADGTEINGSAINYGVTVPNNAPHTTEAYQFVKMLLGKEGKRILEDCGQIPITEYYGNVPPEVKE